MQLINGYEVYLTELPEHFLVKSKTSDTLHHTVVPTDSAPYCTCEWYVHTMFKQHVCQHVEAAQGHIDGGCF